MNLLKEKGNSEFEDKEIKRIINLLEFYRKEKMKIGEMIDLAMEEIRNFHHSLEEILNKLPEKGKQANMQEVLANSNKELLSVNDVLMNVLEYYKKQEEMLNHQTKELYELVYEIEKKFFQSVPSFKTKKKTLMMREMMNTNDIMVGMKEALGRILSDGEVEKRGIERLQKAEKIRREQDQTELSKTPKSKHQGKDVEKKRNLSGKIIKKKREEREEEEKQYKKGKNGKYQVEND